MERIDWRNYDYSDGPPRASSTRISNPYIRSSTPSHLSKDFAVGQRVTTYKNKNKKNVNITTFDPFHSPLPSLDETAPAELNPKVSPSDSVDSISKIIGKRTLSYRPPASSTITSADKPPTQQLGSSSPPPPPPPPPPPYRSTGISTALYATKGHGAHTLRPSTRNSCNTVSTRKSIREPQPFAPPLDEEEAEPFDENESLPSQPPSLSPRDMPNTTLINNTQERTLSFSGNGAQHSNHCSEEVMKHDHQHSQTGISTKTPRTYDNNTAFEEEWNKAENEWKEAEEYIEEGDDGCGNDDSPEEEEFEFESFAGDRSTTVAGSTVAESTIVSEYIMEDVALTTNETKLIPSSILRRSGRYRDGSPCSSSETKSVSSSVMNNNSKSGMLDTTKKEASNIDGETDIILPSKEESKKKSSGSSSSLSIKKRRREKRRLSRRRSRDQDDDDDDTSIDDMEGVSSPKKRADTLQDRTKQAWSVRNRVASGSGNDSNPRSKKENGDRVTFVSFEKNTVHEFVPEKENSDSATTQRTEYTQEFEDDDTYAGRSMDSVYTKSAESEVEDLLKDFFLIGRGKANNPGRRRLRYRKNRKDALADNVEDEQAKKYSSESTTVDEDDTTLGGDVTEDQSSFGSNNNNQEINTNERSETKENNKEQSLKSRSTQNGEITDDDPLDIVWNCVDDGMKTLTSAFNLLGGEDPDETNSRSINGYEKEATASSNEDYNATKQWMKDAQGSLFHNDSEVIEGIDCIAVPEVRQVDKECGLMQLSFNAVKIKHEISGMEYDETSKLNVMEEIKFVVMTVGLPVGIIFGENDVGCWVTRIFQSGNAAINSRGDKIELGDQLASINGNTSMNKSVAEVCRLLAGAPDPSAIELTFIRYIGPFRPKKKDDHQQGWEVIDSQVSVNQDVVLPTTPIKPRSLQSRVKKGSPRQKQRYEHSLLLQDKTGICNNVHNENLVKNSGGLVEVDKKKKKKLFSFSRLIGRKKKEKNGT